MSLKQKKLKFKTKSEKLYSYIVYRISYIMKKIETQNPEDGMK